MQGSLLEGLHGVKGLDAVANAFAATVQTDIVNFKRHRKALCIIHKGVGATGTATITVQACDNDAGANPVAIPFRYRAVLTGDTPSALIEAAAAGFVTTAGSSQLYLIEIDAIEVGQAGKTWAFVKSVEVVASPVLGGMLIVMAEPKFAPHTATVIV